MALYNFAGGSLTQLLFITGDIYTIILSPSSHCTDYIQGNCLPLNIDLIDQNLGMQRKISFKTHSPQSTVTVNKLILNSDLKVGGTRWM